MATVADGGPAICIEVPPDQAFDPGSNWVSLSCMAMAGRDAGPRPFNGLPHFSAGPAARQMQPLQARGGVVDGLCSRHPSPHGVRSDGAHLVAVWARRAHSLCSVSPLDKRSASPASCLSRDRRWACPPGCPWRRAARLQARRAIYMAMPFPDAPLPALAMHELDPRGWRDVARRSIRDSSAGSA